MSRPRKEVGIRPRYNARGILIGWRVFANVAGKVRTCPQFAADTPIGELRAARDKLIEQFGGVPVTAGSFAADVAAYLAKPEVAAMRYVHQYARYLGLWVEALGRDRPRRAITRDELEAVLQTWLQTLSPVTVYHRRTALLSLYVNLDAGRGAPNPVLETTVPAHEQPRDQSRPYADVQRTIARMPAGRYLRKGIRRPSLAKVRAAVVAATGMPPGEVLRLRPTDLADVEAGVVHMPPRRKGKGTAPRQWRLTPAGIAAWRAFIAAGAWGDPTWNVRTRDNAVSAMSHSFKRSARAELGQATPFHLYALRHCVAADIQRVFKDTATTGRMIGHAPGSRCTTRYTMGAHEQNDRDALAAFAAARETAAPAPKAAHSLPKLLPKARKRRKQRTLRRRA